MYKVTLTKYPKDIKVTVRKIPILLYRHIICTHKQHKNNSILCFKI